MAHTVIIPLAWSVETGSLAPLKHPITIAGGGLAGLSLGIALQSRGVAVTLHEASAYPRHRVCGEFISGVGRETLTALGIADCLDDATCLQSASWSDSAGRLAEMQAPGRGISRWKLDDHLQRQFLSLGGTLVTNSRIASAPGVIWAAGRPRQPSPWLGLKCHVCNLPLSHDLEMFTSPGGYIGLAKIEDGMVNICGLFKARPARGAKGSALLLTMLRESSLHALADRLEAADLDESSFCGVAGFQTGLQAGPAFSIGDAASMIPPFTGNGMSMAFESAECALQPALDYAAGRKSWLEAAEASTASQASRFKRRLTTATILHHLLMNRAALRITRSLAHRKMMPFQTLLHLVR
jgi:2-polyprenyl-6-methoxyphenol hydroxylase-like FAD-dependent oxidoreductase